MMVTRRQMRAIFSMRLIYNIEATSTRKIDVMARGIGLGAYTLTKKPPQLVFSNEHVQSHSPIRTLSF
jgi:hypothetical protein